MFQVPFFVMLSRKFGVQVSCMLFKRFFIPGRVPLITKMILGYRFPGLQ